MDDHPQSIRDHDLLIRLDQKVDAVSGDIKELKENLAGRVTALETAKADKLTTDQLIKDIKTIREEIIPSIKYRIAYWSGAIALAAILLEIYFRSKN
jgi:hypothetical protein